jgi:hypothetical protein
MKKQVSINSGRGINNFSGGCMEHVNIAKPDYDPNISRIPELIGKHFRVIAPITICNPNPLQFVKPASASRVSGIMQVELKLCDGNEALERNLKKKVLTIDGKRFEFDKPPHAVDFDTPYAGHRLHTC